MKIASFKKTTNSTDLDDVEIQATTGFFASLTLTGLIASGLTVLTFFLVDLPTSRSTQDMDKAEKALETFKFILNSENDSLRASSLHFLIEAEVIQDEDKKIRDFMDKYQLPDWSKLEQHEAFSAK